MDDDLDVGGGNHILASVSRLRTARKAAATVLQPKGPKPLWGFTFKKYPPVGEPRFKIVDEVRFTALCLIITAAVCAFGFLIADFGLGRITVREIDAKAFHGISVIIGGVFAFLACVLSVIQVRQHWANWTHPPSQKLVVRILYMVPIYAISAFGSLTFLDLSSYIDFVRGVYEAFVIYTFMILLTKYLGGHAGVVEWMRFKAPQPWPDPLCCLKKVRPDSQYLYYLKYGALQYTILAPVCSLAAVVLTWFGAYEEGVIEYDNGYPYIAFILNMSQVVSLYCLVWLYVCMKNELAPFGPLSKFLVVKAVVFATFWQGVGLAIMGHFGWLQATEGFTLGEVQVGMQDFLVTIEMFIAACMHKYTFGAETYADGSLRLLMEQRALYLAEQSYKRAQDAQREAQKLADELAEAADPSLKGRKVEEVEETPEEAAVRKKHMAAMIKKAMDEDTEGDVLFDEDEVDWTTGKLPEPSHYRSPQSNHAFDYIYAYELEQQRAEGVDSNVSPLHSNALTVPMDDIDFGFVETEYVQPNTTNSDPQEYEDYPPEPSQRYAPVDKDDSEYVDDEGDGDGDYDPSSRDEEDVLSQSPPSFPPVARVPVQPQSNRSAPPTQKQALLATQARAQLQASLNKPTAQAQTVQSSQPNRSTQPPTHPSGQRKSAPPQLQPRPSPTPPSSYTQHRAPPNRTGIDPSSQSSSTVRSQASMNVTRPQSSNGRSGPQSQPPLSASRPNRPSTGPMRSNRPNSSAPPAHSNVVLTIADENPFE